MSLRRSALALSLVALATVPSPSRAQNAAPADTTSPPPANPADVASEDAIMHAIYDVISGPAGPRDWQRFNSLFIPQGARLIPTRRVKDNPVPSVAVLTPQDYAKRAGDAFSKNAFYEREIGHTDETFGAITQRFSAYASRHTPDGEPFARGINSFQLFNDGKRWYIVTIYWDDERSGEKIPAKYLGN